MTTHIKIKTYENYHVHAHTHKNNLTLCGLETGGDEKIWYNDVRTGAAKKD